MSCDHTPVSDGDIDDSWFLYVLECDDGSLYAGITTDRERRLHEHNHTARGARYTRGRRPGEMVASWTFDSHSEAASAEYAFKQLSREEKLARLDQPVLEGRGSVESK